MEGWWPNEPELPTYPPTPLLPASDESEKSEIPVYRDIPRKTTSKFKIHSERVRAILEPLGEAKAAWSDSVLT